MNFSQDPRHRVLAPPERDWALRQDSARERVAVSRMSRTPAHARAGAGGDTAQNFEDYGFSVLRTDDDVPTQQTNMESQRRVDRRRHERFRLDGSALLLVDP